MVGLGGRGGRTSDRRAVASRVVYDAIGRIASADVDVLILGETGVGKELVARALHQNSARKSKRFVAVNISAIPESILESELFGHEAGAYTGATSRRIGRFEYANGGTLFLDEVGEMPVDTQVRLLRVLEERKVIRL
ncbi:MAG: sigma-54 factor interaction domain-containing protein, partial [Planctomycetes bacterium]|nr:sigma-54 factor interaction domain-containing protein [Planctomycetota bacterium]